MQQVSVDGALGPLVDGRWREVRTLAIGTVAPGRTPGAVRCEDLSYLARLCDAERFIALAAGEVHRRGVETAGRVAFVVDGAAWEQAFSDAHCPGAVRILDFPHGAQRLSDAAEAVWETQETGRAWAAAQRAELRDGAAETVLAAIRALPLAETRDPGAADQVRQQVLGYLAPRVDQMRDAAFRAQGLPIGSGIVESANTLVVKARLTGAGRRWAEEHLTPMLALRGALCSERWDDAWTAIAAARRGRVRRTPPPALLPAASAVSVAAPVRRTRQPPSPALPRLGPKTIVNGRPTARHPWQRFPAVSPAPANLCRAPRHRR